MFILCCVFDLPIRKVLDVVGLALDCWNLFESLDGELQGFSFPLFGYSIAIASQLFILENFIQVNQPGLSFSSPNAHHGTPSGHWLLHFGERFCFLKGYLSIDLKQSTV